MDWLPISTSFGGRRTLCVMDGEGPRGFHIEGWRPLPDKALAMRVSIPGARTTTRCEVTLEQVDGGRHLGFTHTGWTSPGLSDLQARAIRHRFAASWAEALRRARVCATAAHRENA